MDLKELLYLLEKKEELWWWIEVMFSYKNELPNNSHIYRIDITDMDRGALQLINYLLSINFLKY